MDLALLDHAKQGELRPIAVGDEVQVAGRGAATVKAIAGFALDSRPLFEIRTADGFSFLAWPEAIIRITRRAA